MSAAVTYYPSEVEIESMCTDTKETSYIGCMRNKCTYIVQKTAVGDENQYLQVVDSLKDLVPSPLKRWKCPQKQPTPVYIYTMYNTKDVLPVSQDTIKLQEKLQQLFLRVMLRGVTLGAEHGRPPSAR